jgi:hypothetical protein
MRKRSKYRPKHVLQNPLEYVRENMAPIAQHGSYLVTLKIRNSDAMVKLLRGQASVPDMNTLVAMSNITEALCFMNFGKEHVDIAERGRHAIIAIVERAKTTNRFTPTGLEVQALNELMELHDAQMDVLTVKDMDAAIHYARRAQNRPNVVRLPVVNVTPVT